MTTLDHISRAPAISDPSEWPLATCPDCGFKRPRPGGGEAVCDRCTGIRAEATIARLNAERLARKAAELEARRARLPELLTAAGCPTRYCGFTRAAWEQAFGPWDGGITSDLDGWTGEQPDTWLVLLHGATYGRRKTGLATALLGERIVAGKRCLWLDVASWCRDLQDAPFERRGEGDRRRTKSEIYDEAREAEVLLLDDWRGRQGEVESQRWWASEFAALLRHREAWILPTIGTANIQSLDELERIDPSLISRCDASRHVYPMPDDGIDFRRV